MQSGHLEQNALSCRELALQVAMVGRTFRKQFGFRAQAIIGGVDRDDQVKIHFSWWY